MNSLKIHIVRAAEAPNSYAAAIVRDGERSIVTGAGFDEMLGVVAAAMLRPDNIPYLSSTRPWNEDDAHFGLTREQYEELLSS